LYTRDGKDDYSQLRWATHGLNVQADLAFWLKLVEDADIVPKGEAQTDRFLHQRLQSLRQRLMQRTGMVASPVVQSF
jgi:hypothetical protein